MKKLFVSLAIILLSACGALPPFVATQEDRAVLTAISTARVEAASSLGSRRRAITQAAEAWDQKSDLTARLHYATLLAWPDLPGANYNKALELLQPLTRGAHGPARDYATLLTRQIMARQNADIEEKQLKSQLEALKRIERSLVERRKR